MVFSVPRRLLANLLVLGLAGCGAGSSASTSAGETDVGGMSTGGPGESSGGGDPTTGGTTTGAPSTSGGGSTFGESTGGTGGPDGSTGDASTGGPDGSTGASSTGDASGSTGGVEPFSTFACTELTPVELLLKETISGAFDAQGVPIDVTAVMVKSGVTDFHVDVAAPVAPDDPYAADVAYWEDALTAKGWDVNAPGDLSGDRRYIFIPEGAQFVAKFSLFYYRVYEQGGNGQFEFECIKQ